MTTLEMLHWFWLVLIGMVGGVTILVLLVAMYLGGMALLKRLDTALDTWSK